MKNIALTGGIACGKTTVSDVLKEQGANVIDTDIIARQVVAKGQPALAEIQSVFGKNVILPSGELNRPALREIISGDTHARLQLNNITHPRIHDEVETQRKIKHGQPYNLIVIPLLVETQKTYDWVDAIVVVDCTPKQQITWLKNRDNHHHEASLKALISSQSSPKARLNLADYVIKNTGDIKTLQRDAKHLHQTLCDL